MEPNHTCRNDGLSAELIEYLRTLTTVEGGTFVNAHAGYDWKAHWDATAYAVLLTEADEASLAEAYRVLRPGGHLLLVGSEADLQPVCEAESLGYEVRDCILLADGPADKLHYVNKASRREREKGLGSTGKEVRNVHPTVKPVKLMERLLTDMPRDQGPVCDPFLGSGTTGVAAARTGHPFIGIEREPAYYAIAESRILDVYKGEGLRLYQDDCVKVLSGLPEGSIGAVVCDPPYGLSFMGKDFDKLGEGAAQRAWHRAWVKQAFRVLVPGGVIKAFGGTRTFHHLTAVMREAGFTEMVLEAWSYGSGFPKSLSIGKAIDKVNGETNRLHKFTAWMRATGLSRKQCAQLVRPFAKNDETAAAMAQHYFSDKAQPAIPTAALWAVIRPHVADVPDWVDELVERIEAEREVVGQHAGDMGGLGGERLGQTGGNITVPATDAARTWEGWGTALKPAWEPIVVGRKP